MDNDNKTPKYDLSTLSREALERLTIHMLTADQAREAINEELVARLNASTGDAHAIFAEWCAVNKELSDASDREISRIVAGAALGALTN